MGRSCLGLPKALRRAEKRNTGNAVRWGSSLPIYLPAQVSSAYPPPHWKNLQISDCPVHQYPCLETAYYIERQVVVPYRLDPSTHRVARSTRISGEKESLKDEEYEKAP